MNPFREAWVLVRLNWRIIALCALVAVIVAGLARYDRNRGRFVQTPDMSVVFDTRTGQYCDPGPEQTPAEDGGFRPARPVPDPKPELPRCANLAKSWW